MWFVCHGTISRHHAAFPKSSEYQHVSLPEVKRLAVGLLHLIPIQLFIFVQAHDWHVMVFTIIHLELYGQQSKFSLAATCAVACPPLNTT